MSSLQKKSNFDPLFLIESTSTNWPANSFSSSAPSNILPLDVLRWKEVPAKCLLQFELLEKPYFHPLNLHWCFYHPCRLEVKLLMFPLKWNPHRQKSSSEDSSKFSKYSRASWTFINLLAAIFCSYFFGGNVFTVTTFWVSHAVLGN